MTLLVKPLSPALGAEITGVDLREDLSAETFAEIIDTWHKHLVILFRNQTLSEDDQIRFAQRFGALQKRTRPPEAINEAGHTKYPQLTMLVSNIRENGKLIGSLPDGEMQFHSDQCFLEKPAAGTFLYAIEIPSHGGDTLFLNMYKAYETLPSELKARVDGRKALYVNRLMTFTIEGMDDEEGSALLNKLFDHIEQDQFIYAHHWRVGDLILWDNRCTLHARTDFSDKERRLLRRYTVSGDRVY